MLVIVFPVVNVTQVHFVLAGEEEFVWGREDCQRPLPAIEDLQTIASAQIDRLLVGRSAEGLMLPLPRAISPDKLRVVMD